ncbi:MAG: beta-lactamase [Planctomycetota bacterium]|nr:beta-lactamase [Planctomycetota bacterium]
MDEIFPSIFKVLPTKPLPSKCMSFLVRRSEGNLLFPCFSVSATIHARFDPIESMGGISRQLLGDSHFKTPHCDEVFERFGAPLYCSQPEAADVLKSVKNVRVFPLERHELEPGVEVIPIPGHRPGGTGYLVSHEGRKYLFVGDGIWHDGKAWKAFPTKTGRATMIESLRRLADVEFDVLLANTRVDNPTCAIEVNPNSRRSLLESIANAL